MGLSNGTFSSFSPSSWILNSTSGSGRGRNKRACRLACSNTPGYSLRRRADTRICGFELIFVAALSFCDFFFFGTKVDWILVALQEKRIQLDNSLRAIFPYVPDEQLQHVPGSTANAPQQQSGRLQQRLQYPILCHVISDF